MIGPMSQCGACSRFRSPLLTGDDRATCEAFPDGIPDDVFRNVEDHRRPVDGDRGLRWESNGKPFPSQAFDPFPLPANVQAVAVRSHRTFRTSGR